MKTRYIISLGAFLLVLLQTCGGQGFVNLDFEDANVSGYTPGISGVPVADAFPGWSASYNSASIPIPLVVSTVGYDAISLAGAVISINDTNSPAFGSRVIDGNYSAFLFGGLGGPPGPLFTYSSTLSQTGLVPVGTKSLMLNALLLLSGTSFIVSVNGQPINMVGLPSDPAYPLYGGDISSYAGQTVTLSFTEPAPANNPPSLLILDDIVFSPDAVPEPGVLSLATVCILLFCPRMIWPCKSVGNCR